MTARAYFQELGGRIDRRWAQVGREPDAFSEIARIELASAPVPETMNAASLLRGVVDEAPLPPPMDKEEAFGQPPVTTFVAADFYVAVLFWFDGTTAIHEHGFSGAFRVLEGSSIHVEYQLEVSDAITPSLLVGVVHAHRSEVLRAGDTRPILGGRHGAHSLFHLDHPSATIVVRTNHEPWNQPQLKYLRPGLAYDPFGVSAALRRQLRAIDALRSIEAEQAIEAATTMIRSLDPHEAFMLVHHWVGQGAPAAAVDRLTEVLVERFARVGPLLESTIDELRRQNALIARRRLLTEVRHRTFLAVLLNLPDRSHLNPIIAGLYPDADPAVVVGDLFEELAAPQLRGISGLHIDSEDDRRVLRQLMATGSDADTRAHLRTLSTRIRNSDLLAGLLSS